MVNLEFNTMSIRLQDGRRLAFSEFGDPSGKPVFFFHGWPGARLQGAVMDKSAMRLSVRAIAPDRPGFGLSDFQPGRSILDWPEDLLALANHLEMDLFSVLGLSGGAPYALACAAKIPHRLITVGIISGIGPSDAPNASQGVSPRLRRMIRMCTYAPWLVRLSLWRMARKRHQDPERTYVDLLDSVPEPDRKALSNPTVKTKAVTASKDTFRNGTRGHFHEICLFARPWGFQMQGIQPMIQLWHGEEDRDILPITAQNQAESLSNCQARFLPGEGHYSLYINHNEQILNELIE